MLVIACTCALLVATLASFSIIPLTIMLAATGDGLSRDMVRVTYDSTIAPMATLAPAIATGHLRLWFDAVLRHREEKYVTRRIVCEPNLYNPGFFDANNTFRANLTASHTALYRLHNASNPRNETLESEIDSMRSVTVFIVHMIESALYLSDAIGHTCTMVGMYPYALWRGVTPQDLVEKHRLSLCWVLDGVYHGLLYARPVDLRPVFDPR
jgi:hypothetical protein